MRPIAFAVAMAALLACTGCGVDDAATAPDIATAAGADASTDAVVGETKRASGVSTAAITPDYLAGPWCHAYVMAGDERVEEGIDYVFNRDGTLLYQNNPDSAVDRTGVWKHEGDTLSVGPAVWTITKDIRTVEPDRFVLGKERMQVVFERGACAPEAAS